MLAVEDFLLSITVQLRHFELETLPFQKIAPTVGLYDAKNTGRNRVVLC